MSAQTETVTLDPGECTARYAEGWRHAEKLLSGGVDPRLSSPFRDEERDNGFCNRMGVADKARLLAPATAPSAVVC